ncbi:MAG: uncharacterized protein A8A55_1857 [Amphiamblys sp. WSBS2006]|nr:MAG: uncharacterized protein A8A55_1857 [Amphiamblys sp. WSBS2006]
MNPQTDTLLLKNMFFVFTEKKIFVVPRAEYENIQSEDGFLSVKRSSLSAETDSDERVLCILCHEETKPEDMVSPLCRAMHFVICEGCVQDIKERKNRAVVECPFCREEASKKEYHAEIMEKLFSLRTQQTLLGLEVRPDMEVESVAELALNSKVIFRNISISDRLFLLLISRTRMDVRGGISLFEHRSTQMCCRTGLTNETNDQIDISTNGYNKEKIENIKENIKTIKKRSIRIESRNIHAEEKGVCVLLKHCTVDAYSYSLGITEKKYIEEILKEKNNSLWAGKVKDLQLRGYAVNLLPKLVENQMQRIHLSAEDSCQISTILWREDNSIWAGKVTKLDLGEYATELLSKLRFYYENVPEGLRLYAEKQESMGWILRKKNRSIWVGKVKKLFLDGYAVEILPKLRFHEEIEMEEVHLSAHGAGNVSRILDAKDRSVWVGKVKKLFIVGYAVEILPKLRFHEEIEMEEVHLSVYGSAQINKILEIEDRSIWVGRVKKLRLYDHALQILPKLRIHGGDRIENLLKTHSPEKIAEILGARRNNNRTKENEKELIYIFGNTFIEVFEFKFRSRVSRKRRSDGI